MSISEKYIEDYFQENIDKIDNELTFFRRQYIVNHRKKKVGIIDLLCIQGEDKRYVIIENKKGDLKARDIGQALAYFKIFKNIDAISQNNIKRDPKIIFICTGVDAQFELAYEVVLDMDIEMEVKIIKEISPGELCLESYFSPEYGRLTILN